MASQKKNLQIQRRRQQVADLALQGWTQMAIADRLGVSQATVCQDLKHWSEECREEGRRNTELLRQMELKKLERLEREAWAAWERSQKPAQSAEIDGEGDGAPTKKRIRNQYGDPRFLDQINKVIAARRAIQGLDAPTKVAPTTPDGSAPYSSANLPEIDNLSAEEFALLAQAQQLLENLQGDRHAE